MTDKPIKIVENDMGSGATNFNNPRDSLFIKLMKLAIAILGGLIAGVFFLYASLILFSNINSDYASWAIFPAIVAFVSFFSGIRNLQRQKETK